MVSIQNVLSRARIHYPDRPAVNGRDGWLSFFQLAARVDELRAGLASLGIRAGDRVAVLDVNSQLVLDFYYATAQSGIILVPLNTRLSPAEHATILTDCDPMLVVFGPTFFELLKDLKGACPSVRHWACEHPEAALRPTSLYHQVQSPPPVVTMADNDISQIYYTSGTTGKPKGACLTFGNMAASAVDVIIGLGLTSRDRWLHAAPMFHLVDAWSIWAMPLIGAAQVTLHFSPEAFFETVDRWKPTAAALPPTLINFLSLHSGKSPNDVSSLDKIMFGGSPMPVGILERAVATFPSRFFHSYGATETSGTMSIMPEGISRENPDEPQRHANCAGVPVASTTIQILDDSGNALAADFPGEIVITGPRVLKGYWKNPEASEAAIKGGRYHTGDLGYLDKQGMLFVVGRKKDMIITGGENVYPAEIENHLSTHPEVLECAVVGLPDAKWGERVHAVVVIAKNSDLAVGDLNDYCRAALGGYKTPKSFRISSEPLPKSAAGKIQKIIIRDEEAKRAIEEAP